MIVKHVPMRAAQKSDFAGLVKYITDEQSKEHRLDGVRITNCEANTLRAAVAEVLATQFGNTRANNDKTYHLLISFRAGEKPTQDVLKEVENRVCAGLGFAEHQRISAVHSDTDNLHIHIAINKIHPKRNTIHEPYKAYKTLAEICQVLETEFGLERDNHSTKKTLSEGRASDMEKHSGIESLVSWIRSECLEGIRSAKSWSDLHHYLADNGLVIKEQGAGLLLQSGELYVKPSTVARDISRSALEARLGPFAVANAIDSPAKRLYQKRPVKKRVKTAELYAKYQADQKAVSARTTEELRRIRTARDRKVADAKRTNKIRRAAIKLADGRGIQKKFLYRQAASALSASLKEINTDYQSTKNRIYEKNKRRTWADWLKHQAQAGDATALAALRARDGAQEPPRDFIATQEASAKTSSLKVDNVTKKGTIIYRAGRNAVRDDGKHLHVSKGADHASIEAAIRLAAEKYGSKITLTGSTDFKARAVFIAARLSLPITFADPFLEQMRQQRLTIQEKNNEQSIRRRPDSSGLGRAGSRTTADDDRRGVADNDGRRGAGLFQGLRKPNVKPIGRNPPPQSQNRLRRLSQLNVVHIASRSEVLLQGDVPHKLEHQGAQSDNRVRRNVFGSGLTSPHLAAAQKYIAEREQKRLGGFDISNHYLYNGHSGSLTFAGTRKLDDYHFALLKDESGGIAVHPITKANAQRLTRVKIGEPVETTNKGAIKPTKGRTI